MARQAKTAMAAEDLKVPADRGDFSGEEILACEQAGAPPYVPKPLTSGAKADGRFGKEDFVYSPELDAYRCPAGELLARRLTTVEKVQAGPAMERRRWRPKFRRDGARSLRLPAVAACDYSSQTFGMSRLEGG